MCYKHQSQEADDTFITSDGHYRPTLRGSEQSSATIARITIHTHATILKTKRKSSESCAMRSLLRVILIHRQGWVQDGTPTQRRRVQSLDLLL